MLQVLRAFLVLSILVSSRVESLGYGYSRSTFDNTTEQLPQKTPAQVEHENAEEAYNEIKTELDILYAQCVKDFERMISAAQDKSQKKNLKKRLVFFQKSQKDFIKSVHRYGNTWGNFFGGRSFAYHRYGSMIDMIRLRIRHLKTLAG